MRPRPRIPISIHASPHTRTIHTTSRSLYPRSKPTPPPPPTREADDYYSLLLSQPLASTSPTTFSPRSIPKPPPSPSKEPSRDPTILFGTPLAGPSAARRRAGYGEDPLSNSGLERPREPDNCCMSGCVNCVWDAYREEVEAWAMRRREAARLIGGEEEEREKRKARKMRGRGKRKVDVDVDDEGSLFEGVPVGIREFMATEKRLREKREREERETG